MDKTTVERFLQLNAEVEEFSKTFQSLELEICDELRSIAHAYFLVSGLAQKANLNSFAITYATIDPDRVVAVACDDYADFEYEPEEFNFSFPVEYLWTDWIEREKLNKRKKEQQQKEKAEAIDKENLLTEQLKIEAQERELLAKLKLKYE